MLSFRNILWPSLCALGLLACNDAAPAQQTAASSNSSSASTSGGSAGGGGNVVVASCNGVTPPVSAYAATPSPTIAGSGGAGGGAGGASTSTTSGSGGSPPANDPTTVGSPLPNYALTDVHPLSCGYQGVYGYELFEDKALVVVLLAAWCGFCQSQASYLEQMRLELEAEGKGSEVQFIIINKSDAVEELPYLVKRCSFPILQDVDAVQAWDLHHRGIKDDFYVYDKNRQLLHFLRESEEVKVNLATEDGYATVKAAVLDAIGSK